MKKQKRYVGTKPNGKEWHLISAVRDDNNEAWNVYLDDDGSIYPVGIKLAKVSPSPVKANFSLRFSKTMERLCINTDAKILHTKAPELKANLINLLQNQGYYYNFDEEEV